MLLFSCLGKLECGHTFWTNDEEGDFVWDDQTTAKFTCQSCGRTSSTDARKDRRILPVLRKLPIDTHGKCRRCGGKLWTLSLVFTQTTMHRRPSLVTFYLLLLGYRWVTTSSNQLSYSDVPANDVALLNKTPRDRMSRIIQFSQLRERNNLLREGGRQCAVCGTLFVPADGKLWAQKGYCSKTCLVKVEGAMAIVFTESSDEPAPVKQNVIEVACSSGHRFDVQKSFSGMLRPCPECGEKTRVP